jgi:hypothetical protein
MSAVRRATLRLSLRASFLEKREKWRTPSCFTSTFQETSVILSVLIGATRHEIFLGR